MGEKVSDSATFHPLGGGIRPELRDPANKGLGAFGRNFDKGQNHLGRVLTIGVHHKRVGEALVFGEAERVQDSGPLAGVLSKTEEAQSLQPESLCLKVTAIRAAINDNPNVPPDRASLAQRCREAVAAVVTREKDEIFHQGRVAHCVKHRARKRDMAENIVLRTIAPLATDSSPSI